MRVGPPFVGRTGAVIRQFDIGIGRGIDFAALIDTAGFMLGARDKSPLSRISAAMLGRRAA